MRKSKSQHTRAYRCLAQALRRAREQAGLTQEELGERLHTYSTFVTKTEAAERRLDAVELAEYCRVLGIDVIELLREAGLVG